MYSVEDEGEKMIKSLKIKNFKQFKDFEINNLSLVNLISGKNNVGKSSFLEALFLLIDHSNPEVFMKLNNFRRSEKFMGVTIWENIFYNFNSDNIIQIMAEKDNEKMEITYSKDKTFVPINNRNVESTLFNDFKNSAKMNYSLKYDFRWNDYKETNNIIVGNEGFLVNVQTSEKDNEIKNICQIYMVNYDTARGDNIILDWFGEIEKNNSKMEFIEFLNIIDPNISDVMVITDKSVPRLYVKFKNSNIFPIEFMGDGIRKLLHLYLVIKVKEYDIVLIDEIENGLHYSMYEILWKYIYKLAKDRNCQIIATTHSYENIVAFKSVLNNNDDISYFRLGKNEDKIKAYRFSAEMLDEAISLNMEVR